jgi:hypothetical protein
MNKAEMETYLTTLSDAEINPAEPEAPPTVDGPETLTEAELKEAIGWLNDLSKGNGDLGYKGIAQKLSRFVEPPTAKLPGKTFTRKITKKWVAEFHAMVKAEQDRRKPEIIETEK